MPYQDHLRAARKKGVLGTMSALVRRGLVAADRRLIAVDYPYHPVERPLAMSEGGRRLRVLLERRREVYRETLDAIAACRSEFQTIAVDGTPDQPAPYWVNDWIPPFDAASIYSLLAARNPALYLEVGSGQSTKFARRAIAARGLKTKILSVDPHPRAQIEALCDDVVRAPFETVASELLTRIPPDTVIFVDNSHRAFQNSDVTVFFTEFLPALPRGVVWSLHDIALPDDYPQSWAGRFYGEQYLLMCYLLGGGGGDQVILPNRFIASDPELSEIIRTKVFGEGFAPQLGPGGGCFWLERA